MLQSLQIRKAKHLIAELIEVSKGERKRSSYYVCSCCGKSTHAPAMTDRRKLYLCATCFKGRCDFCDGAYVITVVTSSRSKLRTLKICKECDTKENHPVFDNLLRGPIQEYRDFKEMTKTRRQKALDAMNKAIQEVSP